MQTQPSPIQMVAIALKSGNHLSPRRAVQRRRLESVSPLHMPSHFPRYLLILLAPLTQAVFSQPSQGPKMSSRDEYRACLDESDQFAPRLPILQARLKEHNQDLKRLQEESEAHVATQPSVDTSDQAAIDAFNAKVESLNQRVKALNDQAEEFRKEQIAYNTQVAAMNKRCAGLVVSFKDRDAVRRERLAQGKK